MNILGLVVSFGFLILAMSVHEFAHAWVSYKLGDNTAKYSGRLTLNPLAHIDLMGTVVLPLALFLMTRGRFVFGAAKPVPINYWSLKNPRRDIIWIGLSGPAANFILAFALSVVWRVLPQGSSLLDFIFENIIVINVILGIFNLIPIPPLDGSRVVMGILPKDLAYRYALVEPYGFILLLALIWSGILDFTLWPAARLILGWLNVPG